VDKIIGTDMGGPGATLTPADSIQAMRGLIEAAEPGQKRKFLNDNGQDLPW